jgi:hypothetical protein
MTERSQLQDEVEKDRTDEPKWHAKLHNSAEAAVTYANIRPVSQPGTIVFYERADGKVRTFDFH